MSTQPQAEKKVRRMPDGFGGFIEREEDVKPVLTRVLDGVAESASSSSAAPAQKSVAAAPAPKKSVGESTRSSSSGGPLTTEDLIKKSIENKEEFLGRELSKDEKDEIAAKVKKLLGK